MAVVSIASPSSALLSFGRTRSSVSVHCKEGQPWRRYSGLSCHLAFRHCSKQKAIGHRLWRRRSPCVRAAVLPVDPWSPGGLDSQSIASSLFAVSLFPYIGFLYHLTKSKTAPKLTLFGFYFLLAFVGATIPAGIYAKIQYGTSLSNVDYLHGSAESLLTITNLFIVLGLRRALKEEVNAVADVPNTEASKAVENTDT